MEETQYKVYAQYPDKSSEIRRFCVDSSMVNSFHYLNAKLQNVFPVLTQRKYTVHWKDDENDEVCITSDEELKIAMTHLERWVNGVIKLYVYIAPETETGDIFTAEPEKECGPEAAFHHLGVICDECDQVVVGFRYKCTTCHDFDLCARCEAAGAHAHHCMLRIPSSVMAPAAIKEVLKRTRHFMKSFSGKDEGLQGHKKHRRDRSADKKHKDQHRRERRECRRPRAGWLETVTAYMNEFVNLAGDIDLSPADAERRHAQTNTGPEPAGNPAAGNPAAGNQAAGNQAGGNQAAGNQAAGNQAGGNQAAGNQAAGNQAAGNQAAEDAEMPEAQPGPSTPPPIGFVGAAPRLTPEMQKFLNQVDGMWARMFNMKFTDMFVPRDADVAAAGDGHVVTRESTPGSAPGSAPGSTPDSRASSVASANGKGDGDKADDWTLIHKENDLMEFTAANAGGPATPPAPAASAPPAPSAPTPSPGFHLAQEFAERVTIGQSLYPPLNANTAVLNPEAPEFPQPWAAGAGAAGAVGAAGAGAVKPPVAANTPKAAASTRKLKPHVAAALNHMLAMGFNNDGEWITQLLENYDGNIAAVLDLLTPVNAKKK